MIGRREKISANCERNIIKGLIVSDIFINQIAPNLDPSAFQVSWAKIIARWCKKYQNEYGKAPKAHIQDIFNSHRLHKNISDDDAELIDEFLSSLSQEYAREGALDVKYLIDETNKYLTRRALQELKDDIEAGLLEDDLNETLARVSKFNKKDIGSSNYISLTDPEIPIELSRQNNFHLFEFPGKLGKFIGPLNREDFLSFFGPNKRGKSWFLLLAAITALNRKLSVVYFNFEMSYNDLENRAYQFYCGQPSEPGIVLIPVFDCRFNQDNSCKSSKRINRKGLKSNNFNIISKEYEYWDEEYKPCTVCKKEIDFCTKKMVPWFKIIEKEGLNTSVIIKKLKDINMFIGNKECRIFSWPQYAKSMKDIDNALEIMKYRDNFKPDVIITDLADRIISDQKDRHGINEVWALHRRLAQERSCLVVTASHTNKKTNERNIRQGDSSEESRKEGHITHGVTLNQTDEEKRKGIFRLGAIDKRNSGFLVNKFLYVTYNFSIGKMYLNFL
ncbi:MAG: hypothetical protein ACFFDY_00055 [Candidatus Thorarchaeota archaeon]